MSMMKTNNYTFFEEKYVQNNILQNIGGGFAYTTKGKTIKNKIENRFKETLNLHQYHEVELPIVIDYNQINMERLLKRGRMAQCFEIESDLEQKFHLAYTSEELAATYLSNREEETIYQIRSKFRNENEINMFRRLEFTMLEVYNFSQNEQTYHDIKKVLLKTIEEFLIPIHIKKIKEDDMGIVSEEIFYEIDKSNCIEVGHFYMMGDAYKKTLCREGFFSSFGVGIDRLLLCYSLK